MQQIKREIEMENYWRENLQYPDWYIKLEDYLREKIFPVVSDPKIKKQRHKFYKIVEDMLNEGTIPLAETGPDFDVERKSIDAIVIHHTSEESDIRLGKLSAIGFVRQYGLDYLVGKIRGNMVKGKPIWSGHFNDGKMVFFAYHWLVRPDGTLERLLRDKYIGWQAGDWDINTRSIAISLSGDYSNSIPSEKQIESVLKIINDNYPNVEKSRIFGHREINPKTICPGNKFLGPRGWKKKIILSRMEIS